MLLFFVTPCLVVAGQRCTEGIPMKKRVNRLIFVAGIPNFLNNMKNELELQGFDLLTLIENLELYNSQTEIRSSPCDQTFKEPRKIAKKNHLGKSSKDNYVSPNRY